MDYDKLPVEDLIHPLGSDFFSAFKFRLCAGPWAYTDEQGGRGPALRQLMFQCRGRQGARGLKEGWGRLGGHPSISLCCAAVFPVETLVCFCGTLLSAALGGRGGPLGAPLVSPNTGTRHLGGFSPHHLYSLALWEHVHPQDCSIEQVRNLQIPKLLP